MKKVAALLLTLLMLSGCSLKNADLEQAMTLRAKLLAESSSFDVTITADYGDKIYIFGMNCLSDPRGNVCFTVTEPETIAGITGTITDEGGNLTFDDVALTFPLLADDQVTPVSAPWILMKTLRGGYMTAASREDDLLHLTVDDSYEDDALQLDIWLNGENQPVRAEILYDGRRILTLQVSNFTIE